MEILLTRHGQTEWNLLKKYNENANRLIRRFIPKGTVITDISEEFIQQVEDWITFSLCKMGEFLFY